MNTFLFYFLLFLIYAIIGWIVETTYMGVRERKIVNRGFLIGPYIPIYGWSAIVMVFYLNQYKDNVLTVFIMAVVICTFIEYITSYLLEKIFKARWWDYSNEKFNINGRVCLKNGILFGLLGVILIYILNPFLIDTLSKCNTKVLNIISIICFIIFTTDSVSSILIVFNMRNRLANFRFDATVEIKKLISKKLERHYFQNRVFDAFPKLKFFRK